MGSQSNYGIDFIFIPMTGTGQLVIIWYMCLSDKYSMCKNALNATLLTIVKWAVVLSECPSERRKKKRLVKCGKAYDGVRVHQC